MIRVVRPTEPDAVRKALTRCKPSDNKTELERAREYYARIPPPTKAYPFSDYKDSAVCRALDELFHDKCAYCESRYRAVDSRDIEHYRPKGGVTEAPTHKGYWWLAAAWKNLLPSCPPCNQRRHQTIFDPGMTLEEFERALRKKPARTSGKANSFPVRNDLWVTAEGEDIATEDPLLINPCERDPADHLEFFFDWNRKTYIWEADAVMALVRPRSRAGEEDPYGKASIGIYGLNRAGLVRERAARVKDMQLLCQPVVDLARDLGGSPSAADLSRLGHRLMGYKTNLVKLAQADQPYAGMARAFIAQFEGDLKRLANDAG
jgi:hypothetical protein